MRMGSGREGMAGWGEGVSRKEAEGLGGKGSLRGVRAFEASLPELEPPMSITIGRCCLLAATDVVLCGKPWPALREPSSSPVATCINDFLTTATASRHRGARSEEGAVALHHPPRRAFPWPDLACARPRRRPQPRQPTNLPPILKSSVDGEHRQALSCLLDRGDSEARVARRPAPPAGLCLLAPKQRDGELQRIPAATDRSISRRTSHWRNDCGVICFRRASQATHAGLSHRCPALRETLLPITISGGCYSIIDAVEASPPLLSPGRTTSRICLLVSGILKLQMQGSCRCRSRSSRFGASCFLHQCIPQHPEPEMMLF